MAEFKDNQLITTTNIEQFNDNDSEYQQKAWILIDGIPALKENDDYVRYMTALQKAANRIISNDCKQKAIVYIPYNKQTSKDREEIYIDIDGCAFIQFPTENDAITFSKQFANISQTLIELTDLQCYTLNDIKNYENLNDKYNKLTVDEFQKDRNLLWWLIDEEDEAFRDQYVIRYKGTEFEETNVFWMDQNQVKTGRKLCFDASELKQEQKEMTRQKVEWSSNGYYLLSTHPKGVQLWGGPNWSLLQKLQHNGVDHVSFSPNDTFLITCNAESKKKKNIQLKIWDVLTGDLIAFISYNNIGPAIKLRLNNWWPVFKWSFDEKYIAKINSSRGHGINAKAKELNKINIFEIYEDDDQHKYSDKTRYQIQKLGDKSLRVESLFDMEFSPTQNILAYTTFAQNNIQSTVTLISIPNKQTLRIQTLGDYVKKAYLYWQSDGKYLVINMGHSSNSKKIIIKSHSIGIINIKDRNMPFLRIDNLGIIKYFSWEPHGDRFGVIHGGTKRIEPNVSIYDASSKLILSLTKRRCNELYWAPKGGRFVIVNIDKTRRSGGELEFVDINKSHSQTVKNLIHENLTDIEWDPSGRYLLTATTQNLGKICGDDQRYIIWSFQGDKLFQHKIKYFYQILWRPRPNQLFNKISIDKQEINNKLIQKRWDKIFEEKDKEKRIKQININIFKNQQKLKIYNETMQKLQEKSMEITTKRQQLLLMNTSTKSIKSSSFKPLIIKDYMMTTIKEKVTISKIKTIISKQTFYENN